MSLKLFWIVCFLVLFLENMIVINIIIVVSILFIKIVKFLYNVFLGVIGKLMGRLNVIMKNVDDGLVIFKVVNI